MWDLKESQSRWRCVVTEQAKQPWFIVLTERKAGQRERIGTAEPVGNSAFGGARGRGEALDEANGSWVKDYIRKLSPPTPALPHRPPDWCSPPVYTLLPSPHRKRPELYSLEERQIFWEGNKGWTSKSLIWIDPFWEREPRTGLTMYSDSHIWFLNIAKANILTIII